MREKGFPLEEVRKGARQPPRLFPDDINGEGRGLVHAWTTYDVADSL